MTARRVRFDIRQAGRPLLIGMGVWLLVCAAGYLLLVRPKVQEYEALNSTSGPERQALIERTRRVENLETYLEALRAVQTDLDTLHDVELSTRELRMVEIHIEVERLCREFNIDWEQVSFGNDSLPEEGLDKHMMIVPLEGGYANLRSFLQAVEESEKFLLVERVAIGEAKEGGVMLQLNITLATYFTDPEALELLKEKHSRRGSRRRRA